MPSSFIRTVTVGSGIGPDLLTFATLHTCGLRSARGLVLAHLPPVGSFAPP